MWKPCQIPLIKTVPKGVRAGAEQRRSPESRFVSFGAKFRLHLYLLVFCFFFVLFFFNKLSIGKKLICKVERQNVQERRSDETAHYEPSHLDLHCLQKPIVITYGSERAKNFNQRL